MEGVQNFVVVTRNTARTGLWARLKAALFGKQPVTQVRQTAMSEDTLFRYKHYLDSLMREEEAKAALSRALSERRTAQDALDAALDGGIRDIIF